MRHWGKLRRDDLVVVSFLAERRNACALMRRPAYNESGSISWSRIGLTNRAAATYLFVRRNLLAYNLLDPSCASLPRLTSYIYYSAIIQQKRSQPGIFITNRGTRGTRVNPLFSKPKEPTPPYFGTREGRAIEKLTLERILATYERTDRSFTAVDLLLS